jgi:hypothetical protein
MEVYMDERARIAAALSRVADIKGFYIHVSAFSFAMTAMLILNLASGGTWWVHWVFGGWGIGVIAHGLAVFGRKPKFIGDWEKRKLRQALGQ